MPVAHLWTTHVTPVYHGTVVENGCTRVTEDAINMVLRGMAVSLLN